jgi:transcriptional regulator with XRE-family HTH domain
MANERLRAAMLSRGLDAEAAADAVGVDPKTVERWIAGRLPHRRLRMKLAAVLREDERYLWPDGLSEAQQMDVSRAELLAFFPHRSLVPSEMWLDFFGRAAEDIGVLVHAGGFLAENARFLRLLREKASAGVRVRILLGDPDSPEILRRGEEEGLGEGVAYKVRNALAFYRPLFSVPGIAFRLHCSTLHNSLYRSDSEWLVNTQVCGASAPQAPVLHLKRMPGAELVSVYEQSFEMVWREARELTSEKAVS